jgi:hypothetical protein
VTTRIKSQLRLHLIGGDKANDHANKETYQSGTDAVDEPSQRSTHHAEENPENLLLLVSILIRVTVRANVATERDALPAVRAAHLFSPLGTEGGTLAVLAGSSASNIFSGIRFRRR